MEILAIILLSIIRASTAIIGYDCGTPNLNISAISLLEVGDCNLPSHNITNKIVPIQLLQMEDYSTTELIQCKVEIDRTIYYCGMYSHVSVVKNGRAQYISEISRDACKQLHRTGFLALKTGLEISGIKANTTTTRSVVLSGSLKEDGSCSGESYTDSFGNWETAVTQAVVKISLQSYMAPVDLDNNQIHLKSGAKCLFSETTCLDVEAGNSFWDLLSTDSCRFNHYKIIYQGRGNKTIDLDNQDSQTMFSINTQETLFAWTIKGRE